MAETWSPEDEEGFGISGPDKDALTADQQKALDDLRVQTARDNQEYLCQHPEVKAMLSLLIRETLLEERDVRTVAGELFRSEKQVVAAVRRMLGMEPTLVPSKKRRSQEDEDARLDSQVLARETAFSEEMFRKGRRPEEEVVSRTPGTRIKKRRDTPAPWIHEELEMLTRMVDEMASNHKGGRCSSAPWSEQRQERNLEEDEASYQLGRRGHMSLAWLQRELEKLTHVVDDRSLQDSRPRTMPWMHTGKSSSQLRDAISGEEEEAQEEVVPLARRDTPAPWSTENDLLLEKEEREKYVLGLLERILEEPSNNNVVFEKLDKIAEEQN